MSICDDPPEERIRNVCILISVKQIKIFEGWSHYGSFGGGYSRCGWKNRSERAEGRL